MAGPAYDPRVVELLVRDVSCNEGELSVRLMGRFHEYTWIVHVYHYLLTLCQQHNPRRVVLDFDHVPFIDNHVLRTLDGLVHHCRQRQCGLAIRNTSPFVRQLLQLARLDRDITLF